MQGAGGWFGFMCNRMALTGGGDDRRRTGFDQNITAQNQRPVFTCMSRQ